MSSSSTNGGNGPNLNLPSSNSKGGGRFEMARSDDDIYDDLMVDEFGFNAADNSGEYYSSGGGVGEMDSFLSSSNASGRPGVGRGGGGGGTPEIGAGARRQRRLRFVVGIISVSFVIISVVCRNVFKAERRIEGGIKTPSKAEQAAGAASSAAAEKKKKTQTVGGKIDDLDEAVAAGGGKPPEPPGGGGGNGNGDDDDSSGGGKTTTGGDDSVAEDRDSHAPAEGEGDEEGDGAGDGADGGGDDGGGDGGGPAPPPPDDSHANDATTEGGSTSTSTTSGSSSSSGPYEAHPGPDTSIPNHSPYSSPERIGEVRKKWGYWKFVDPRKGKIERPTLEEYEAVFTKEGVTHRDIRVEDFPQNSWQTDQEYVRAFLAEAKLLVNRTKESIYHSYGATDPTDTTARLAMKFEIPKVNSTSDAGRLGKMAPWTTLRSWDGLKRRLLHAIITQDTFTFVLGGHSAAAGHGNNFNQSYALQLHQVVAPVFDRLGVRFVARNLAQGGLGTLQQTMAGMDLRGKEADIVMWDSMMTERDGGYQDFFHRQALLGGDRAPVLWDGPVAHFHDQADADVGVTLTKPVGLPLTKDEVQVSSIPYAAQYLQCEKGVGLCGKNYYTASCWVDHANFTPPTEQNPPGKFGGQASWHYGHRLHMFRGRAMAFTILDALDDALTLWEERASAGGSHPLAEEHWHVTEHYRNIRDKVKTMPGGWCEEKMYIPRLCRVAMHGRSEFTPRAHPDESSLRSIIRPTADGYVPFVDEEELYDGPDPPGPWLAMPEDAIDVRDVAGARRERRYLTSSSAPQSRRVVDRTVAPMNHAVASRRGNNPGSHGASHRVLDGKEDEDGVDYTIFPGSGWTLQNVRPGLCDGTVSSHCGRIASSTCLMSGHNDGRGSVSGDEKSGWLVMDVPGAVEGLIILRMEVWHGGGTNPRSKEWTEYNNGIGPDGEKKRRISGIEAHYAVDDVERDVVVDRDDDHRRRRRYLKGPPPPLPDDFVFEFALNGTITSQNKTTFLQYGNTGKRLAYNFDVFTLLDDPSRGGDCEVAVRMRGGNHQATLWITHIYWG